MRDYIKYIDAIDACFNKPPMTVPEHISSNIMTKYPTKIVTYNNKAFCILVFISDGFYGISWVATKPENQKQGYGRKLLEQIHNEYKGVFVTKAILNAERFYEKLGYKSVFKNDKHSIMFFVNDPNKVIF